MKAGRPDIPVTIDSIARARAAQATERARVTADTGLQFLPDGTPVLPESPADVAWRHLQQFELVNPVQWPPLFKNPS